MAPPEEYPGLPQNVEAPNHKNNAAETGGNGFGDMNHIYIYYIYNPIINQYRHLKIENVQLRQVWVKSIQPVLGCGVPDPNQMRVPQAFQRSIIKLRQID